jgi:hypothetical protein
LERVGKMPPAVLEDPAQFQDLDAAEALAARLNKGLEEPLYAVAPFCDQFFVVDAQGRRVTQMGTPPRQVNPKPGIPDRFEPAPKPLGRGIEMITGPDGIHTVYTGRLRHG